MKIVPSNFSQTWINPTKKTMKKLYNRILTSIFSLVFLVLFSNEAKASHAMGADITYRCLGNNQYEVTMSFYRDCSGIPAPLTMDLQIDNTCGFNAITIFLNPTPGSPTQISPLCPSALSTCNGGSFTGIEEWIYTGIVTLPAPCASWTFSHSESARNAAITTTTGFGDNLFVYSNLNNLNGLCDDSPTFSNRPVPFACVGQRFCFNHGAFDLQGDSLSYQIITPRNGPTAADTVTYISPYTASQPVLSSPPMSFNPATGDFCMTPTLADVTILAILVNQYRNGVLIGQVERDIQLTVLPCNNILPSATGINGNPSFSTSVCAGNQLCFSIRTVDPNVTNTTTITWDNSIPNATFTTYGGQRDSARFCWTPTAADISNTPYCFTATVSDDNCPYIGIQVYAYCITVRGVDPDAGPDQTIPCGATANLNGSATGGDGNFVYTWNPGSVGSQQLNGVGVGEYILTVTSAGCSNSDTVDVLAGLGVPTANFNFVTSCVGTPVTFTDNSVVVGSTISSWSWDFGDFTGDNNQNTSHQYASNGTYTVVLTVSTPTGCTASYSQQVTINTNVPSAQFSSPSVCDGVQMSFTDQSTGGPINSWAWDFGDAGSGSNSSNAQNPNHQFSTFGNYTVTLAVTNTDGCQHQIQQNVTVNANPTIVVSDATICEGEQATLDGPVGFSNYSWSNGPATQSISISPILNTNYTLTVTDANGCTGSYTAIVNVNVMPIPNAGLDQTICEGTFANIAGSGTNVDNWVWNPGNISGQNISVNPSTTTDYTLTASTNAGCVATDLIRVNVNPMPTADAGDDLDLCKGETITINATTGGGNIVWMPGNFNTQSITVTPGITTTYTVTISDAIGCSGSDDITVVVNDIPNALYNSSGSVCEDNPVTFNDQSNIGWGAINSWNWDFGNNISSSVQNPTIPFSAPGNYNVTLIVRSDGGCADTITQALNIWARPVASFLHTNVCEGNPISFSNTSFISDASPLNYSWNLGDNTSSNNIDVNHQYGSYGGYISSLIVTSANGCIDSTKSLVNVYALPTANFSVNYACEESPAVFNNGSTIPQGNINSWFWTFGDSKTATDSDPLHTYDDPGTYDIHMLITSDHGCQDSIDGIIRIVPKPLIDFETENACLGYTVDLTDLSSAVTGTIQQYNWSFGDGLSSTDQNPTHTYSTAGWFQVSLTATSDSGCISTLVRPNALKIYSLPNAQFITNANESSDIFPQVNFFNQTSAQGIYFWNFGDGTTSTDYSPTHLYATTGAYDVQLLTIDQNGCVDSTLLRIEIKPTSNVYIPNAFTPNGDTNNDFFKVYSYNVKDMKVQIYDRWGLKIIEWDSPLGAWDGRIDGSPAQADVYVYRVATVDINDKHEVFIGHISLVR